MQEFQVIQTDMEVFIHCGSTNTSVSNAIATKTASESDITALHETCEALNLGLASKVEFNEEGE